MHKFTYACLTVTICSSVFGLVSGVVLLIYFCLLNQSLLLLHKFEGDCDYLFDSGSICHRYCLCCSEWFKSRWQNTYSSAHHSQVNLATADLTDLFKLLFFSLHLFRICFHQVNLGTIVTRYVFQTAICCFLNIWLSDLCYYEFILLDSVMIVLV